MLAETEILSFLPCDTPDEWVATALEHLDILLIDHAHCEKKAASSAMSMIYRYPAQHDLIQKMSRLAREELRHLEQVLTIMTRRGITFCHLSPARYAAGLHERCRQEEPGRLIDSLIIGAFIEARSCERFAKLVPHLDPELSKFYHGLLASEARHFEHYLTLAERFADQDISDRVQLFATREAELVTSPDTDFRFHSGPLVS